MSGWPWSEVVEMNAAQQLRRVDCPTCLLQEFATKCLFDAFVAVAPAAWKDVHTIEITLDQDGVLCEEQASHGSHILYRRYRLSYIGGELELNVAVRPSRRFGGEGGATRQIGHQTIRLSH